MFREMTGDVLKAGAEAVAHGCNCMGAMGAGIAAAFAKRWPEMEAEYVTECQARRFRPGDVMPWAVDEGQACFDRGLRWVYNLGTQLYPGADARCEWIRTSVIGMLRHAELHSVGSIAVPRIGAGIGGLEWDQVRSILRELGDSTSVSLVAVSRPQADQPRFGFPDFRGSMV